MRAIADETTTSYADFLYELRVAMVRNFPRQKVLLSELGNSQSNRRMTKFDMDGQPGRNYDRFSGNQARVPILLAPLQGGGPLTETGTVNVPHTQEDTQAHITMSRYVVPMSVTLDLEFSSKDNSAAEALALKTKETREAMGKLQNEAYNGNGDGVVAHVSGGTSPGLVLEITAATFNEFQLYPGRIVDVRDSVTGPWTFETGGQKRRIASTDPTASPPTVTFDTAAQAGGDSGNITFDANSRLTVQNATNTAAPPAMQGLQQISDYAVTGTFENVNRANFPGWRGVDGRNGAVTTVDLGIQVIDKGLIRLRQNGADNVDFYVGDPASILKHEHGLLTLHRYGAPRGTLSSGFEGVLHKNKPLIQEDDHKPASLTGVTKEDLQVYAYFPGPDFIRDDGSMFRRFSRALPREAWLADWVQLGAKRVNRQIRWDNLST